MSLNANHKASNAFHALYIFLFNFFLAMLFLFYLFTLFIHHWRSSNFFFIIKNPGSTISVMYWAFKTICLINEWMNDFRFTGWEAKIVILPKAHGVFEVPRPTFLRSIWQTIISLGSPQFLNSNQPLQIICSVPIFLYWMKTKRESVKG